MLFGKRERAISRILVVEDEPLVAFDNEHLLGEAGYQVVATVDTVAEAVRWIAGAALDLVLTDISLHGDGNGLDVARAANKKGVPVLFVTGECPPEAQPLAIGCLDKPYSSRTLNAALDAVDRTLRGKAPRKLPRGLSLYAKA